jgi:hypothetical protein
MTINPVANRRPILNRKMFNAPIQWRQFPQRRRHTINPITDDLKNDLTRPR